MEKSKQQGNSKEEAEKQKKIIQEQEAEKQKKIIQ